jgi:hypothetical protein
MDLDYTMGHFEEKIRNFGNVLTLEVHRCGGDL